MKNFIYILMLSIAIITCVSCSNDSNYTQKYHCYYAKWEIIYPDTTIQYEDTLYIVALSHKYKGNLNIKAERGRNYISDDWFEPFEPKYPVSSTCPMRLIEYKLLGDK